MAKVLKCRRGGEVGYPTTNGGMYYFSSEKGKDGKSLPAYGLFLNNKQAEDLLAKFPNELEEAKPSEIPENYKAKIDEYGKLRMEEAAKAFPDIIKKVLPTKKK